jgi:hypothetical protein
MDVWEVGVCREAEPSFVVFMQIPSASVPKSLDILTTGTWLTTSDLISLTSQTLAMEFRLFGWPSPLMFQLQHDQWLASLSAQLPAL